MAHLVFHGPNDSNACRKYVKTLAKELGGKPAYLSFLNRRRMDHLNGWFSEDTIGKASYSIRGLPLQVSKYYKNPTDRKAAAAIVRRLRRVNVHGLKFRFLS